MEEYAKVLNRLQMLCSKRECCSSDVFRKAFTAFDGDKEKARMLLDELARDGFVDDFRYAAAFAREKSRLTGWGPVKISSMLAAKGVPKSIASEALKEIDEGEADSRMRSVIEAKHRILKGDPQEKFKLLKFALTRGYDYDKIAPVVDEIISNR